MKARWSVLAALASAALACALLTGRDAGAVPRAAVSATAPRHATAPRAAPAAVTARADTDEACPDCKPGSLHFAPPVAAARTLDAPRRDAQTGEATRYTALNQRLARHLASEPTTPAQQRARAAQQRNLQLRAAEIERTGVRVVGPARPE